MISSNIFSLLTRQFVYTCAAWNMCVSLCNIQNVTIKKWLFYGATTYGCLESTYLILSLSTSLAFTSVSFLQSFFAFFAPVFSSLNLSARSWSHSYLLSYAFITLKICLEGEIAYHFMFDSNCSPMNNTNFSLIYPKSKKWDQEE